MSKVQQSYCYTHLRNCKKRISLSSLTLHPADLLLWKKIVSLTLFKIIAVCRLSTFLRVFVKERSRGITPPKNWVPLSLPWSKKTYLKKGISNSFRTNFTIDFACGVRFQLHSHDLFEKAYKTVPARIITPPPPTTTPRIHLNFYGKPRWGGEGESNQQPKIDSFPPPEKFLIINLHLPLSKVSFLPSSFFLLRA